MPIWLTGKLIGMAVGSIIVIGIGLKVWNMIGNHFNAVENLQQSLANEKLEKERVTFQYEVLVATNEIEKDHEIAVEAIRESHQAEILEIRVESQEQKAVLEDRERLDRLTKLNPSRIERLANKATEARFNELEATFNN